MHSTSSDGGDPDSSNAALVGQLKEFHSAGRGFWGDVSDEEWNSWQWQLKNRIGTLAKLQGLMPTLTPEEHAGTLFANTKLSLGITPYFFNLIDASDERCPI